MNFLFEEVSTKSPNIEDFRRLLLASSSVLFATGLCCRLLKYMGPPSRRT